jgi:hypothetical protein
MDRKGDTPATAAVHVKFEDGNNGAKCWERFFALCQEYAQIARQRAAEAEAALKNSIGVQEPQIMQLEGWK